MSDFQERLFQERDELQQRISSLEKFIVSEPFKELEPTVRNDLREQLTCMCSYLSVLNRRVSYLCRYVHVPPPLNDA